MHKFEYVMSGCAHTRITLNSACQPPSSDKIRNIFEVAEEKSINHTYTGLYNAFTEAKLGQAMFNAGYMTNPMHSDSGGLQIITRGLKIDDKIKTAVYTAQAAYSSYAMCFDDIPVEVTGAKSGIGKVTDKTFRTDWIERCAKSTIDNVIEQCKVFEKLDADTKIMLVVQGNCLETYYKWVDICVKNLPKELYSRIGGLSFAGTSSGAGELEDVERLYAFSSCDAPDVWKSGFHLLGVGSISRMIPCIGFLYSGVLDNVKISYDSTTHSSGITFRRYIDKDANMFNYGYDGTMMTLMYSTSKEYFNIEATFQQFCDVLNYNRVYFIEKYGEENIAIFHEVLFSVAMASVIHTTHRIDFLSYNKKAYKEHVLDKCSRELIHLPEVKTKQDYDNFIKNCGRFLTTSRIEKYGENTNLESFFE